jgi:hypothetical protein
MKMSNYEVAIKWKMTKRSEYPLHIPIFSADSIEELEKEVELNPWVSEWWFTDESYKRISLDVYQAKIVPLKSYKISKEKSATDRKVFYNNRWYRIYEISYGYTSQLLFIKVGKRRVGVIEH